MDIGLEYTWDQRKAASCISCIKQGFIERGGLGSPPPPPPPEFFFFLIIVNQGLLS